MAKNKLLNEKLRSHQELPEGMSWESMESGILDRMPLQPIVKPSAKTPWYFSKVLLAFALLSVVLGLFIFNQKSDLDSNDTALAIEAQNLNLNQKSIVKVIKDVEATNNQEALLSNIENDNSTQQSENVSNLILKDEKISQLVNKVSELTHTTYVATNNLEAPSHVGENIVSKNSNEKIQNDPNLKVKLNTIQESLTQGLSSFTQNPTLLAIPSSSAPTTITKASVQISNELPELFTNLELLQSRKTYIEHIAERNYHNLFKQKVASSVKLVEPLGKAKRLALELGVGATYWLDNYNTNDPADAKSRQEKALVSYGTNLSLSYKLNNEWSISTGLSYQKMESLFDYKSEARDTTIVQGLISQRAKIKRVVLRNNKYTSYSLPVMLHKSWHSEKLEFVAGLGASYRFNVNASGKTLAVNAEGEEVVTLLENIESINVSSWNAQAQLALKYSLSDKYYVGISTNMMSPLAKYNLEDGVSQRPLWLEGNVVMGYRF